jgi:hypothetical protein
MIVSHPPPRRLRRLSAPESSGSAANGTAMSNLLPISGPKNRVFADADDGERDPVERQRAANRRGRIAEPTRCEMVAHNGDRSVAAAALVVAIRQQAACSRTHTQH